MIRPHQSQFFPYAPMAFAMTPLTLSWTVSDVMRCYPISILLFNKLGIDTGGGASMSLEAAAHKAGLAPDELLQALHPCTDDDDIMPIARTLQATNYDHTCAH